MRVHRVDGGAELSRVRTRDPWAQGALATAALVLPITTVWAPPGVTPLAAPVVGALCCVLAGIVVLGGGRAVHVSALCALRAGTTSAALGVSVPALAALGWSAYAVVEQFPAVASGAPGGAAPMVPWALLDGTALLPGAAAMIMVPAVVSTTPLRHNGHGGRFALLTHTHHPLPSSAAPPGAALLTHTHHPSPADLRCSVLLPAAALLAVAVAGFRIGFGATVTEAVPAALAVLLGSSPCALLVTVPSAVRAADRAGGPDIRLPLPATSPGTPGSDPDGRPGPLAGPRAAGRVDVVVLAGTDALTGRGPGVVAVQPDADTRPTEVLRLASAVAAAAAPGSDLAPFARALSAATPGDVPVVAEPDEQPGRGLSGLVAELRPGSGGDDGTGGATATVVAHAVLLGSPQWLREHGVALPAELAGTRDRALAAGEPAVAVAWDGLARAVLTLSRCPAPGTAAGLRELRAAGVTPALLTPDDDGPAHALAAAAGIDTDGLDTDGHDTHGPGADGLAAPGPDDAPRLGAGGLDVVRSRLDAAGRAAAVTALRARGHTVAVAADPLCDAAALAAANLAITVVPGEVARPAAPTTITVHGGLDVVARALVLARRTERAVVAGLRVGTAATVVGALVAAAGLPAPVAAAIPLAGTAIALVTTVGGVRPSLRRQDRNAPSGAARRGPGRPGTNRTRRAGHPDGRMIAHPPRGRRRLAATARPAQSEFTRCSSSGVTC
ncbi:hypothetical protein [Pseudonocardia phyllosphaerae]|uniref:hypothetical protein n=1 Tax=Pseudonocardia phyllosphaerae TaxID=3390502 RepID=UPI00397AFFC2